MRQNLSIYMKFHLFFILSGILLWITQSCISPKTYLMSESLRVHFEEENTQLKQDSTLTGMKLRSSVKLNSELINKLGSMTADTSRLNRQIRILVKQENNPQNNEREPDLTALKQMIKNKEDALGLKASQLDAKEKELSFKELEIKSIRSPQTSEKLNANLEALYNQLKSELGPYGVESVNVENKGDYFQINAPNSLLFDSEGTEVRGKGLAIMIKLAELLKNQPVFVKVINENQNRTSPNSISLTHWNMSALRAAETANMIARYGFPPQNVLVSMKEVETKTKAFTHILISQKGFQ